MSPKAKLQKDEKLNYWRSAKISYRSSSKYAKLTYCVTNKVTLLLTEAVICHECFALLSNPSFTKFSSSFTSFVPANFCALLLPPSMSLEYPYLSTLLYININPVISGSGILSGHRATMLAGCKHKDLH